VKQHDGQSESPQNTRQSLASMPELPRTLIRGICRVLHDFLTRLEELSSGVTIWSSTTRYRGAGIAQFFFFSQPCQDSLAYFYSPHVRHGHVCGVGCQWPPPGETIHRLAVEGLTCMMQACFARDCDLQVTLRPLGLRFDLSEKKMQKDSSRPSADVLSRLYAQLDPKISHPSSQRPLSC
jgi:hypothetical protein